MSDMDKIAQLADYATDLAGDRVGCSSLDLAVQGLGIWYSRAPARPEPALFDPRLYIVLQGEKTMTFATRNVAMQPGMFAVSSIGVPFVTSVELASAERPYLGIGLVLDPATVADMLPASTGSYEADAPSIAIGRADASLLRPLTRLLAMCSQPKEATVLAPLAIKEIHYRLLTGEVGSTIRQLAVSSQRSAQIRKVAACLRQADRPAPTISELAAMVGMSVTSLHRHFKMVTGYSPIEYGKHVRLIAARSFLASGTMSVAETANSTGYSSPSQFSREYKKKFGTSPRGHLPGSVPASS